MSGTDPHWYKSAIVYQLHVKAFFDADDDGIGDFRGLTRKLDYLQDLGVTALWLLPFYPSPLRDDGYDIGDYKAVNSSYGSMGDFRRFVREAHDRGMRVITELVINHTSDQHRWFQRARRAKPGSAWRDFYVWSDTDQKYGGTRIIFCDTEPSNWSWDPVAQAYYWHRFFSHQPDLNFDNPRVFDEVTRVMKFWLDTGVDGLRLDAIPYLCEREGTNNENLPETHGVLRRLRGWLDAHYDDRMFLGEANQWPEDVRPYFGDGDECHMAFHFPLMPRLYMAVAQEDRYPITDILRQTPEIPDGCQWAIFLRNHDELTLEMVSDRERDYLWSFYAADTRARINMGIRRRLAPLLDNDMLKIELLNSLLMSMPGTPIVYYGDEIGMGDNIYLGDRDGVRTPMQWSPDRNGGFSRSDPARLYLPPIMDPIYGFEAVNVEAQSRDRSSLLSWMRRLIGVRRTHTVLGTGSLRFLYPGNRKVLAYLRSDGTETILCVANLSRAAQPVELDLSEFRGRVPVELLGRSAFPPIGEWPYFITLGGHGFYWFLLTQEAEAPSWHEPQVNPLPEFLTLVMRDGFDRLVAGGEAIRLAAQVLPDFLPNQRWFAAKDSRIREVAIRDHVVLPGGEDGWLLMVPEATMSDGARHRYLLPLEIAWEKAREDPLPSLLSFALTRVRRFNRVGVLHDAMAGQAFTAALARAIRDNLEIGSATGSRLVCRGTRVLSGLEVPDESSVHRLGREQSNTSMLLGETMILKLFRRLEPGPHPEIEIGRFLTEVAGFRNAPQLLGSVELVDGDGVASALAILQVFVRSQADGWTYTLDYLERFLEDEAHTHPHGDPAAAPEGGHSHHAAFLTLVTTLGRRTAELHRAFATTNRDPAFRPETVTDHDLATWGGQVRDQAAKARAILARLDPTSVDAETAGHVAAVLAAWDGIETVIARGLPTTADFVRTRIHGDFHLGQVVLGGDDFYLLDFEGEPARSVEQRRAKQSPLRDVAGMVRSFDYAAWSAWFAHREARQDTAATVLPLLGTWTDETVAAFLAGYGDIIGHCPSVPTDPEAFEGLLNLFVLEKGLYEICYEAANRPAWLRIPVQGVLRLLEGTSGADPAVTTDMENTEPMG